MANQIQHGGKMRVPVQRMPANAGPPAAAMTPKEIVGIVRRHIFMIVFFTIMGTIAGGGSWYLLQRYMPKYTSAGTIEVLPPTGVNLRDFTKTQLSKDIFYEFRATKAFGLRHQGFRQSLLEDDDVRETQWYKSFDTVADKVEDLEKNLHASADRNISHIRVSMTCGSALEASVIAKTAIKIFLDNQEESATKDTRRKLKANNDQLDIFQANYKEAEASLKRMREGTTFAKLDKVTFQDYLESKLENLENVSNNLAITIKSTNEQVEILTDRKNKSSDEVVKERVEHDPVAVGLRRRVDDQEVEIRRLRSQFGINHPRVKETAIALEELKVALKKQQDKIANLYVNSSLITEMEKLRILQAQLSRQEVLVKDARAENRDINKLRADYDIEVTRRDEYLKQLEEKKSYIEDLNAVLTTPDLSKVKWGNTPLPPLAMSSPSPIVYIPGGFILGFMIGIGLSFAVELLNDLMRSPSDVMKHLRTPLLGMICHKSQDKGVKRIDLYHVVRDAPYSIMSEAYRQFRTNLKLSGSDGHSQKTLLVTSGGSGDGKTTVAVNTAYTFVADDKRVLLIDTNFRKPSTTILFKRTKSDGAGLEHPDLGLSNYLMNQCDYSSIIRSCDVDGLDIIDSGPLPLNPSELLGSDKMAELIKKVRQDYDFVVIDGPPMLVSEAKTLASQVDGTVVVFNAGQTRRGAAQRTLRELKEVNANIVGTVLVGVKSMKGGYFHEVYDSYRRYQKVKPALKAKALQQ
jgi:capsular exopolysaccharide synthesis family protein